jgi:hypothetical protein
MQSACWLPLGCCVDPIRGRRSGPGPEAPIKDAIKLYMEKLGWYVIVTHGNAFQSGLPDLYCCHLQHGQRWVEVKNPLKYSFTKAQWDVFPALACKGVGVWILTAATDEEYKKLWLPPNYHRYMGHTRKPF